MTEAGHKTQLRLYIQISLFYGNDVLSDPTWTLLIPALILASLVSGPIEVKAIGAEDGFSEGEKDIHLQKWKFSMKLKPFFLSLSTILLFKHFRVWQDRPLIQESVLSTFKKTWTFLKFLALTYLQISKVSITPTQKASSSKLSKTLMLISANTINRQWLLALIWYANNYHIQTHSFSDKNFGPHGFDSNSLKRNLKQ